MLSSISADMKAFIASSCKATTTCELTKALLSTTQQFGVNQAMFIEFKMISKFPTPTVAKGNVSPDFAQRYLAEHLYKIDPFIRKASLDLIPFSWHEIFNNQHSNKDIRYFQNVCRDFDMLDGFVVPSHCPGGAMGMISFMGPLSFDFVAQPFLQQVAVHYRSAMRRLLYEDSPAPSEGLLTLRQLECVRWIAMGKSDWEIAAILGLSESTINRHVELAKERLGVHTRVQVVVEALRAGYLDLGLKQGIGLAG
jgi:DNA-binding CsgD family transcriptional regulator